MANLQDALARVTKAGFAASIDDDMIVVRVRDVFDRRGKDTVTKEILAEDIPSVVTEAGLLAAPCAAARYLQSIAKQPGVPVYAGQECIDSHGRFRYIDHGMRTSVGDAPCIPDLADPMGKKHWPGYVSFQDPQTGKHFEGPRPFKSRAERQSYERLTGQRVRE